MITRVWVASDRRALARLVMAATRPSATVRVPSMVADWLAYQLWASTPVLRAASGALGFCAAICSASFSWKAASLSGDPLVVLLKYSCSAWLVDALNSASSACCDSEACSSVATSVGPNVLVGELSAANRTARWSDISFSTSSSEARVLTLACRLLSLAPAPAEALNVFAV